MSSQLNLENLVAELHQSLVNLTDGKETPETPNQLSRIVDLLHLIASSSKSKRNVTFPTALLDMLSHGDSIKNHVFQELYQTSIDRQKRIENIKSLKIE
jgi:hypothetical protein